MPRKNIHVVPSDKGWAVKKPGGQTISRHPTQGDAIERGRNIAKREKGELVIHRPNGRIRDRDSYGNDPFPPKVVNKSNQLAVVRLFTLR